MPGTLYVAPQSVAQGRIRQYAQVQVLGKRRPDGTSLLSVSELRDGIVCFEDGDEAERFGNLLEADGSVEVLPCTQHAPLH